MYLHFQAVATIIIFIVSFMTSVNGKTVIACEGKTMKASCPSGQIIMVLSAVYGRSDRTTCKHPLIRTTNCRSDQTSRLQKACNWKQSCSFPAAYKSFGVDPCFGTFKYLTMTYYCTFPIPGIGITKTCENSKQSLSCGGQSMRIVKSFYGRSDRITCPHPSIRTTDCYKDQSDKMKKICNNKKGCSILANNPTMGGDICFGTYKYLTTVFSCEDPQCPGLLQDEICEGKSRILSCPAGESLSILKAFYGRSDRATCRHASMSNLQCYSDKTAMLKKMCDSKGKCSVGVTNSAMGGDPCLGTYKYLSLFYTCGVGASSPKSAIPEPTVPKLPKGKCIGIGNEVSLNELNPACTSAAHERKMYCVGAYHEFCKRVAPQGKLFGITRGSAGNIAKVSCVEAKWSGLVCLSTLARYHSGCPLSASLQSIDCYSAIHRYCKEKFGNEFAGIAQRTDNNGRALIYCFKPDRKLSVLRSVLNEGGATCKNQAVDGTQCFTAISSFCNRFYNLDGGMPIEQKGKHIEVACYDAYWAGNVYFRKLSDYYRELNKIVKVCSFSFFVDQGKILGTTPTVLFKHLYDNRRSTVTLRDTFSFSKVMSYTTSFDHEHSFTIGVETTVKTSIPFIAEGKVTVSASYTGSLAFGKSETHEQTFSRENPVEVPPGKAIEMSAVITRAKMDVPWKATGIDGLGAKKKLSGIWHGVSVFDLKVSQRDVD